MESIERDRERALRRTYAAAWSARAAPQRAMKI